MSSIAISYRKDAYYPDLNDNPTFRPSIPYPEYPFENELSKEENLVYDMVRETLHLLMLDKENYGTSLWNPLGKFIKPGDYVVLKPNLVMHKNFRTGGGGYALASLLFVRVRELKKSFLNIGI